MPTRKTILAMFAGAPLLGVLIGLAADPKMVPPPEPPWRKLQPDVIFTQSQRFADAGPQDLSPAWDNKPSWKRRPVATRAQEPAPASPPERAYGAEPAPLDEGAAGQGAAFDAQSAIPPGEPALSDEEESGLRLGGP